MGSVGKETHVMKLGMSKTVGHRPRALIGGLACWTALGLTVACSSGARRADQEKQDSRTELVDCTSYVRELRACSAAVGAPAPAADTLAATLSSSDEATRLHMESACARDRNRLRASCK
jgi:hypothetical protein